MSSEIAISIETGTTVAIADALATYARQADGAHDKSSA